MKRERTLDVYCNVLRDNVVKGKLFPDGAPSIRMDADSDIKTSLSATFKNTGDIEWYRDEIQPVAVIDGTEHKFGVFAAATIEEQSREGAKSVKVEAYDRCWRLAATTSESLVYIAAGTNYISAIESLLIQADVTLVSADDTDYLMQTDREDWNIGTDYLTIVNQLLDEINYEHIWFDANGIAQLHQKAITNTEQIKRSYDCKKVESLMLDNFSYSLDLYNAPNVFIVKCDNPDLDTIYTAKAENNYPSSMLSITRRGKRICGFYEVDNIPSQAALNEYANILCMESALLNETVKITTAIYPDCGVNDVVAVVLPEFEGVCIETGWNLTLQAGGEMTHLLRRRMMYE